jgi:hypothetical protein
MNSLSEKIAKVQEIEKKVLETETRINATELRTNDLNLQQVWNLHFLFNSNGSYAMDIISLAWYLELSGMFKRGNPAECLKNLETALTNDPGNLLGSVNNLVTAEDRIKMMQDIMRGFSLHQGFEPEKARITQLINTKWFGASPTIPLTQTTQS